MSFRGVLNEHVPHQLRSPGTRKGIGARADLSRIGGIALLDGCQRQGLSRYESVVQTESEMTEHDRPKRVFDVASGGCAGRFVPALMRMRHGIGLMSHGGRSAIAGIRIPGGALFLKGR